MGNACENSFNSCMSDRNKNLYEITLAPDTRSHVSTFFRIYLIIKFKDWRIFGKYQSNNPYLSMDTRYLDKISS